MNPTDLFIVAAFIVVMLMVAWNGPRVQDWAFDRGWSFGLRHPDIGLLFGVVILAVVGLFFAKLTVAVVSGRDISALLGVLIGAVAGIAGMGLWFYAYTQDYEVSRPAVRLIQGHGLLLVVATIAALVGDILPPAVQGFTTSMITITLLSLIPLTVVGWRRGRKDPEMRELLGLKAFALLLGQAGGS